MSDMAVATLEAQLDSFALDDRMSALRELAAAAPAPTWTPNVNLHIHSFFSYNPEGWSPAHIAWATYQAGLHAAGLCDFDVLDGLEEFHRAGLILGMRTTVNVETRAFLSEFADVDINSPGEPGVSYVMGCGFGRDVANGSPEAGTLAAYREQAAERNRALVARINAARPDLAIDYERDVVPLSPGGCPTERHIISAYREKARAVHGDGDALVAYWATELSLPAAEVSDLLGSVPATEERIRARFAKSGGIGYEQPTDQTFPPIDDFLAWVAACGAIPTITWLDGTTGGESDPVAMCECLMAKGGAALNIIPDRNWNVKDPAARERKVAKLAEVVAVADRLHLPINIGTEMNKAGLPFVDDLAADALRPHAESFTRGADVMVGHTQLLRYADYSYVGANAAAEFGDDREARNAFFARVGRLPGLTEPAAKALEDLGADRALSCIRDSAAKGEWTIQA